MSHYLSTRCWGEEYHVEWTGSIYRHYDNGEQASDGTGLLRRKIEDSVRGGGDDPADPEIAAEIDAAIDAAKHVDQIEEDDQPFGRWGGFDPNAHGQPPWRG